MAGKGESDTRTRFFAPEIAKAIGAVGICWFHLGESFRYVTYWCLPMFLMLGIAYVKPERTWEAWRKGGLVRAQRLIRPWLIWSFVYGVLFTLRAVALKDKPFVWIRPSMVFTGTSIHLWYLPYAFLASVLAASILLIANESYLKRVRYVLYASAIVCIPVLFGSTRMAVPIAQWAYMFPAVLGAIGFTLLIRSESQSAIVVESLAVSIIMIAFTFFGYTNGWSIGVGLLFGVLSLLWPYKSHIVLSDWAFSVYLIHPAVAAVIKMCLGTPDQSDVLAILTILTSGLFAFVACKSDYFKDRFL